ncbi:ATP-binding protein, partial [Sphaerisporangium melleum]
AARLRTLSAAQIADRLDDRFRLLTGGSRTALPRHHTLRAVVEWSWDLLEERERVLARRLAVFAGGGVLEAIETVCSDSSCGDDPRGEVLETLGRLVDKSFVAFDGRRYRMLETIRAYVTERLAESGEERRLRAAHARFYTGLAQTADPRLRRDEQVRWLAVLSAEHDNLTAALRWSVTEQEPGLAARLVGALGWYWFLKGRRAEGAQRSAEVAALLEGATGVGARERALALSVQGILMAGGTDQWHESKDVLERALRLARASVPRPWPAMLSLAEPVLAIYVRQAPELAPSLAEMLDDPEPWVVACAHLLRAHLRYGAGLIEEGERDVRASLAGFRSVGDRWGISTAMAALAEVSTLRGDDAATIAIMREALMLAEEIGAVEDTPYMRTRLAAALHATGDRAGALEVLGQALELCRVCGDRLGESGVHGVRGDLAREEGDLALARHHYEQALRLASGEVLPAHFRAVLLTSAGLLAEQEGDTAGAWDTLAEALRLACRAGDGGILALALIALAAPAVREGDAGGAAVLLGGAARVRGVDEVVGYDHRRITAAAIAALGPGEYRRCYEHGRSMPHARLLTLAERRAGAASALSPHDPRPISP